MSDKIVHFDICGPDISPLSMFYSDLFGWKVSDADGGYAQVETGNGLRGGLVESDLANVTFGIQVDDLDSMLERAQQLGGTDRDAGDGQRLGRQSTSSRPGW